MHDQTVAFDSGRFAKLPVWLDNSGTDVDVIISTRVRLARNLANHSFPLQASLLERKKVFEKVSDVFKGSAPFKKFDLLNFTNIARLDQRLLVERRIASTDLIRLEGERGVACDRSMQVTVMINEEDHLRFQCLNSGCKPQETWNTIDLIDEGLGQKLPFAYHHRKGFLTSCPANSGTGLRVSFLLHLPGLYLTKALDSVLQGASQTGIATRGFYGEHKEAYGGFFQLSNMATMGACEAEFIEETQRSIREIANVERKARERLLKHAQLELSDKINRAYGILLHALTLSVPEFVNLSSVLRLGVVMGLFPHTTIDALNRSAVMALPAHLEKYFGMTMNEAEASVVRADKVREILFRKPKRKIAKTA